MGYATFARVLGGESVAADLLKILLLGLVVFALWLAISARDRRGIEQYRSREGWFLAACMLVIVMARATSLYVGIFNP